MFERVASNPAKKITQRQWYERLFRTVPVTFEPYTTNENSMFQLVMDHSDNFPSFENFLYADLDM
jgi:hypothetical protein